MTQAQNGSFLSRILEEWQGFTFALHPTDHPQHPKHFFEALEPGQRFVSVLWEVSSQSISLRSFDTLQDLEADLLETVLENHPSEVTWTAVIAYDLHDQTELYIRPRGYDFCEYAYNTVSRDFRECLLFCHQQDQLERQASA